METVLLVILLVLAIILIGVVLIQRSEGGALGIGGPAGLMTARGSANLLTRVTAVLATLFILLSLTLAVITGGGRGPSSVMEAAQPPPPAAMEEKAPAGPQVPEAAGELLVIPQEGTESWRPEEAEEPKPPAVRRPRGEPGAPEPAPSVPAAQ